MEMLIGIIVLIVWIVVNAIGASLMKQSSIQKGYGEDSHIGAICFWLGIIGYLYVISLPDKIQQSQNQKIIQLLENENED